ncbi:nicotinamide-nucleotide amidase [Pustulibacterium marinum]|uniref:CinA-like protein n=1 Tax=Pustulibacterium marinum TaxID=1224947 RepID=A0A1I7FA33_9FLAO|nr:competence/damage-inducible protein A [Pustulibacterium marinum]SFU32989.1 nicotinamide-nucleotide amidase [Pustulibacterium marinum]
MVQAEIITIGDEILIGQIVDTNSAYIGKALNKIGVNVYQISSVQDDEQHILNALSEATSRVDIVIITGGLGPTKDDITKHTICKFFGDTLVQNKAVLAHVEELFAKHIKSTPISDLNRAQAMVPSSCEVLMNNYGTAPGMWLEKNGKVYISMPGVPFEMKALMEETVLSKIQQKFKRPFILHKTILTAGLGESAVANRLSDFEEKLPEFIKLAYLPNFGRVRLRLTAKGSDEDLLKDEIKTQTSHLYELLSDIIYGEEDQGDTEVIVGNLLKNKKYTLATAESCTGGKIAETITSVPGASAYFKGSIVSYATETKLEILKVPSTIIDKYSVVSAEVAESMALNVQKLLKTDFAVATTGNAGPSKGDSDAEVGTVYVALAHPKGVFSKKCNFGKSRERVINRAVIEALEMLRKEILKN